jgi:formylglycine-generating enzyme required for sulfatase activity
MERFLDGNAQPEVLSRVHLGVNHEEQHQELLLTDILHAFYTNPLRPAYLKQDTSGADNGSTDPSRFVEFPGGIVEAGFGGHGFCYDNELPRHRFWLEKAPLYWNKTEAGWRIFTLRGELGLEEVKDAPVSQVSYFEADAYARWAGRRLPTESEWEAAADSQEVEGNLMDSRRLIPARAERTDGKISQLWGDCWEWTASAYLGYPGFEPLAGSLGEYNGKFMSGQMVLRGGSCATPRAHIRASYRNFFPPDTRWQFSGIRLAGK